MIVVTGVSLANAEVYHFDCLVSQIAFTLQASVKTEFGSNHFSIIVEGNIASTVFHELETILHSVGSEFQTSFGIVCNFLSDLDPESSEG